jgi:ABC-2 type transport system permease protein
MNTATMNTWRRRDTLAVYLREAVFQFWNVLRTPGFALPTLLFPTIFYLFFGLLFGHGKSGDVATYLLATYGTFGIMAPSLFGFGVGIAMEREHGILALKRVCPMPPMAYLFAKAMMAMLFALVILTLLSALGVIFGHVRLSGAQWVMLYLTLILGTLPFCALGLAIGLRAGGQSSPAIINLIYLPMSILSGLWVPLHLFPHWLQAFAQALPAYHLSQLALGIVHMGGSGNAPTHLSYLAGFTLVCLLAALRGWRRIEDR